MTTATRLTNADLADMLHGAVDAQIPASSRPAAYPDDRGALLKVAGLIREGEIDAAMKVASDLETAVRDIIPAPVWVAMGGQVIGVVEDPPADRDDLEVEAAIGDAALTVAFADEAWCLDCHQVRVTVDGGRCQACMMDLQEERRR